MLCLATMAALAAAACDRSGGGTESRYATTLDLAPTIAQLGAEEQADVDEASEKLAGLGDVAVPALEAAVASEPRPIQLAALETLGQIGSPRADAALIAIATRPTDDEEIRATALLHLGENGHPAARSILEAALEQPSATVSQTAAVACGALCTSPAAIDRIIEIGIHDVPDAEVVRIRTTLSALFTGPDKAAAAHAREAVRTRTAPILAGDGPLALRTRAALFAADDGVPDVEPVLLAAAADPGNVVLRAAAIQWLGRYGSSAAVPILGDMLQKRELTQPVALALQAMVARGIPEAKAVIGRLAAARPPAATNP